MNPFQNLHQPTRSVLEVDDLSYLFFGGTAYLGLLANTEYIDLYQQGIARYGLNNGTSRSNNVQLGIYQQAEEKMAQRFGYEAAALFSSGYLAAQAAIRALVGKRVVLYAPASHPALWIDYNPNVGEGFDDWAAETVNYINNSGDSEFVIISNCIDNLKPANYDFSIFESLSETKNVLFILDDSHGLAIVKENDVSSDISILRAKENIEIVIVSSLAKGLGTDAGLVLGDTKNINIVKRHPIFLGASPSSPAAIYALVNGDTIYKQAFDALHRNIDYFSSQLEPNWGLSHIENFPVFSSNDPTLYDYLNSNNVLISSFPYPLSTSPPLNRIVISALHIKSDLDCLIDIYGFKCK